MFFVYKLTIRQLSGRWRLLITFVLAALPVIMAVIRTVLLADEGPVDHDFENGVLELLLSVIMPLVVLAISSAAFTNEIEDRTLANLTLTPIPRWKIVVPKLLGAITVGAPMITLSAFIASFLIFDGDMKAVAAASVSAFIGVSLYSTAFIWTGLMTTKAIGFGLLYVFLWENMMAGLVGGVRYLSINHYTLAIMHGIDDRRFASDDILSFTVAIGSAVAVIVIFLALSIRRLRTMDVP
jgi:ABC-2 type transport system permease protein